MPNILVTDDDPHLREVVRYALARQGFTVVEAANGVEALAQMARQAPDLVVLDVVMPEMDGIETCRRLREKSRVPIIFLSSRDEELDRVLGIELGADDYLTKPFSTRELVARVKAVLRRVHPEPVPDSAAEVLRAGPIRLDAVEHRVHVADDEVPLTVTEFALLKALMRRPGKVYTRDELTDLAYGENYHLAERTLDSHIRRIRAKFRVHDVDPVETVHGLGYRLGLRSA